MLELDYSDTNDPHGKILMKVESWQVPQKITLERTSAATRKMCLLLTEFLLLELKIYDCCFCCCSYCPHGCLGKLVGTLGLIERSKTKTPSEPFERLAMISKQLLSKTGGKKRRHRGGVSNFHLATDLPTWAARRRYERENGSQCVKRLYDWWCGGSSSHSRRHKYK